MLLFQLNKTRHLQSSAVATTLKLNMHDCKSGFWSVSSALIGS